jgi:hypothetical protein
MKSLWCRDFSRGDNVLMTEDMMRTVLRIGTIPSFSLCSWPFFVLCSDSSGCGGWKAGSNQCPLDLRRQEVSSVNDRQHSTQKTNNSRIRRRIS